MKRKLSLETKYLKHQLHVEMVKHKETQKNLHDTETKLRNLELLMELREKRSRHANSAVTNAATPMFLSKNRKGVTSQSLTNLNEEKSDNFIKDHRYFSYILCMSHSSPDNLDFKKNSFDLLYL